MAHLITGLIFIPILGAIFLSVVPRMLARAAALGCSVITALLAAAIVCCSSNAACVRPLLASILDSSRPERSGSSMPLVTTLTAMPAAMWYRFDPTITGLQMVQRHIWIPAIGAQGLLGVDGLSLLLVLLTSIVFLFAFFAGRMSRGFYALMLVMQAALYG